MIRLFIALYCLSLASDLLAQKNFQSGYYMTLSGDTVRGFIDYRNWSSNPSEVSFQKTPEGPIAQFLPSDILSFFVSEELYISSEVDVYKGAFSTNSNAATVFLMVLFSGKKKLYYYRSPMAMNHFYIPGKNGMDLLQYEKTIATVNGRLVYKEKAGFKNQLAYYLSDCKNIQDKITNLKYTQSSLQRFFEFYYNCTNTSSDFKRESEGLKYESGIVAGVFLPKVNMSGVFTPRIVSETPLESDPSVTGGVFLNIIFPRAQGKWSVYNDLTFQTIKAEGERVDLQTPTFSDIYKLNFDYSYIKLTNLVGYRIVPGKVAVHLQAGMSNGLMTNGSFEITREVWMNGNTTYFKEDALETIRKYEFSLTGGVLARYQRISAELRYESGNGMSNYSYLKSKVNRTYFLVAFRF